MVDRTIEELPSPTWCVQQSDEGHLEVRGVAFEPGVLVFSVRDRENKETASFRVNWGTLSSACSRALEDAIQQTRRERGVPTVSDARQS